MKLYIIYNNSDWLEDTLVILTNEIEFYYHQQNLI